MYIVFHCFIVDKGGSTEVKSYASEELLIYPEGVKYTFEITLVGSWVYSANEYIETLGFLKNARAMGIPVEKLVTDHYPLEQYVDAMEKNISLTGVKIAIVME